MESELFGYRKGAFTGAVADHPGRLMQASRGTLFLDEVGELPLSLQAKLLRFLESGECQAIGDLHSRALDVRVCAATHRDLHAEVQRGRFREDLFYRLYVVPLELPPLRARTGDVALLLRALTATLARRHALPPPHYSGEAIACLEGYAWPGNVRELRNLASAWWCCSRASESAPRICLGTSWPRGRPPPPNLPCPSTASAWGTWRRT